MVVDKRTVHARRRRHARIEVEHVTIADQLLGTALVEDGSRIDFGRDLKRDPRRNVRLYEAGYYVDRGTLGGKH